MEINLLENESGLLGYTVARIDNWDSIDEINSAGFNLASGGRAYVYCQIDATDILRIHQLERIGFCFSEFRIYTVYNTDNFDEGTGSFYPYPALLIGDEIALKSAVKILKSMNDDDRFSCDPIINKTFSK